MNYPSVPDQIKGDCHDIVSMQYANTLASALVNFDALLNRLKSVNEWHDFSDKIKAKFQLHDPDGTPCNSSLKVGQLISISIPGPGNPSGHGKDWTEIIEIQDFATQDNLPFYGFTLKPCAAPDAEDDVVAHFYKGESTNTFIVRRIDKCIYIEVIGRNQLENTSDVPMLDLVRNKAVALGSKFGIGNLNWLGFTNALLEPMRN